MASLAHGYKSHRTVASSRLAVLAANLALWAIAIAGLVTVLR
jgi:hypothetical protein